MNFEGGQLPSPPQRICAVGAARGGRGWSMTTKVDVWLRATERMNLKDKGGGRQSEKSRAKSP